MEAVQYCKFVGLASPVPSNCNSDAEDDGCLKKRAVQFFQCPKPNRLEPIPKKLRCPTPPVNQFALSNDDDSADEEDEDDNEDEDDDEQSELDLVHADRFRRTDSDSDASSEVFYCE